jgi:hypothetical protein
LRSTLGQRRHAVGAEPFDLEFKLAQCDQALIPSPLQLTGDQAVFPIGRVILALRAGGLVAACCRVNVRVKSMVFQNETEPVTVKTHVGNPNAT